jgi:L-ribulose-5-phosphate 4-epimerase
VLEKHRLDLTRLHLELPKNNLVAWTSGNISSRDFETNLVVIKPSGVMYEDLSPESMVILDLDGRKIEGNYKPSSDTATHLYIYNHRPDVGGIVHTHSTYATAFAAVGKPIPPVLTALCDEFGGEIPLGGFAPIGGQEIGIEVIKAIGKSKAVLLKNHGVFTIGKTARDALKSAVMVEDIARTIFFAMQLGTPLEIPSEMVARLHRRYTEEYGQ